MKLRPKPRKSAARTTNAWRNLLQVPAGAQLRRDLQQLVKFVGLALGGGAEFGVGHSDRSESGNGGNQGFFIGGKSPSGRG